MPTKKHMESSERPRFAPFDVVLVPFPYADRLAEKRRPALVVSGSKLSAYGLIWVAMITTAEHSMWSCDIPIRDIERAGLPAPSIIRPAKIACLDPNRIVRRLGRLEKAYARKVAQQLRAFLGAV